MGQKADDVIWTARVMIAYQTSIYFSDPGFWPHVAEVDLATGRRRVVQPSREGVFDWYADGNGVVRMGIRRQHQWPNAAAALYRLPRRCRQVVPRGRSGQAR